MPIFDGEALLITLDATGGVGTVETLDVYTAWKDWLQEGTNKKYPQAFLPDGGNELTPGITQGSYSFLRNDLGWRIKPFEEDATILVTGNLVPTDSTLPILIPTIGAFTVGVFGLQPITQSVTPLLLLQQETSYNGIVHVDLLAGTAGTEFPIGTASEPVSNMDDALTIASNFGIFEFHGRGILVVTGALDGQIFEGFGVPAAMDFNGFSAGESKFRNLRATGDLVGSQSCTFNNCIVTDLLNVSGTFLDCDFSGTTSFVAPPAGEQNFIGHSASFVAGTSAPIYDMQDIPQNLQFRDYSGGLEIRGCSDAGNNISIDLLSGNAIIAASCTEGTIVLRGVGTYTNNGGPNLNIVDSGLINPSAVQEAVHARSRYSKRDLMVYDPSTGFMTSARERWFPTRADAIAGTNATDTFTVAATPDGVEVQSPTTFDKIRDV